MGAWSDFAPQISFSHEKTLSTIFIVSSKVFFMREVVLYELPRLRV